MFKKFLRSRDGHFAVVTALCLVPILAGVGLATDYASLLRMRAKMQDSLDAAVLAAAAASGQGSGNGILLARAAAKEGDRREAVFNQQFDSQIAGYGMLSNITRNLSSVSSSSNVVETSGTASADVSLFMKFVFGESQRITVNASAKIGQSDLEIVTVLDNTGSMALNGGMANLRVAAEQLFDNLASMDTANPGGSVRAALVPFVTAVNVNGDEFDPAWIDMTGAAKYNGSHFPTVAGQSLNHIALFEQLKLQTAAGSMTSGWNNTGWKGCVESRAEPYNLSDDAPDPSRPDTLFTPYFAPDDPGFAKTTLGTGTNDYGSQTWNYTNSYLNDAVDKTKLQSTPNLLGIDLSSLLSDLLSGLLGNLFENTSEAQQTDAVKIGKYIASTKVSVLEGASRDLGDMSMLEIGPNRSCPTPIVPLTDDFGKLKNAARNMMAWRGSGTNVAEGIAWGRRVLSPGEPYTGGSSWKSGTRKVIVVLTDGTNETIGATSRPDHGSDYTSLGYVADGRYGITSTATYTDKVNKMTAKVCEELKRDQGVQIITVLLAAGTAANVDLYKKCASTPDDFYNVTDVTQLKSVFGSMLKGSGRLRLTQ